MFNKDDLEGIKKFGGRRERVDYFLELCKKLLKENRDIVCVYLERNFFWFFKKFSYEELCKLFFVWFLVLYNCCNYVFFICIMIFDSFYKEMDLKK